MNSLSLVLVVAGLAQAQAQDTPWSQDVRATRKAALEEMSPCVILVNSDAKAY